MTDTTNSAYTCT